MTTNTGCVGGAPGRNRRAQVAGAALLIALLAVGCRPEAEPVLPAKSSPADRILREMIAAYRQASSYADRGVVRLRYRQDGRWIQDEGRLSIRFERPNRLLIRAYQLTLASDGDRCQAIIADASTRDLDGQVLLKPISGRLTLDDVYADPLVVNVMASGMGGPPVGLELLLNDEPLEQLMSGEVVRRCLDEGTIDEHRCDRVSITLPEGTLILWIDQQSRLLRRMEYPTGRLAAQLGAAGAVQDLSLTAEMREAAFDIDLSGEPFRFDIPEGARLVQRLILPPPPLPSGLLGRRPEAFHFSDGQGRPLRQQDLLGQPAVLVWFNMHPASEASLRMLSQLEQPLEAGGRVACYAVCTEPAETSNRQLQQEYRRWGLGWPLLRDLQAVGRDVFQVPAAPTLVVLDARGVVQMYHVGADPALAETLPQAVGQLLRGEDVAGPLLAEFRENQEQYQRALTAALAPE